VRVVFVVIVRVPVVPCTGAANEKTNVPKIKILAITGITNCALMPIIE